MKVVAMTMTDPSDALMSFQQAHENGDLLLQPGEIDAELLVHLDRPNGKPRFTYVRIEKETVTALVIFAIAPAIDGLPCFQIGYAVPKKYQKSGRAKNAVRAAIVELQHGLSRNQIREFYIEAIVGVDNNASQNVATETISLSPLNINDEFSKLPALRYLKKIERLV